MNCGNCGKGNEYGAEICAHCGSTLALTEYFRRKGFVEKKDPPPRTREEQWDREILTTGYRSKHNRLREDRLTAFEGGAPETPTRRRRNAGKELSSGALPGKAALRQKEALKEKATSRGTKTASSQERKQGKKAVESTKQTHADSKKAPTQGKEKPKKIPKSKVYNHTTKTLSLAEKMVKKKTEKTKKKGRKWLLSLIIALVLLIVAAGIFIGTMDFGNDEHRYTQGAEAFARAMVMDDKVTLTESVHPKMHGSLRPLGYENVNRCDTKVVAYEKTENKALEQELKEHYGITDTVETLYRVHVGCTVYADETYACAMDVYMANIGGKIYAVKAENIIGSVGK